MNMGRRRKPGKGKKTCKIDIQEENYKSAPHSFVFHRGHVGRNVKQLVHDTRAVMEPFTAKALQIRKKNVLKDFVSVAGLFHVSHFIVFTKTDVGVYMRLCRLPRGPTLTFKVHNYSLTGDVISSLKKPNLEQLQFLHHPLLVMNNFSGDGNHIKVMAAMFQNMFPSINVNKVKLNEVRRCVLINYHSDTSLIDFRHYNIKVKPMGISRSIKKLVDAKVPNLSKYGDISEYVNRVGYSSESEVELDGPMNEVILPQNVKSRGNIKSSKSAVRLTELGPRMTLELIKIEDGICEGQVMYHGLITKTDEELAALKAFRENKRKLKEERKKQQEENVKKKKQQKIKKSGMDTVESSQPGDDVEQPETQGADDDDDDVEYFKKEVGRLPDADTFVHSRIKRKPVEKTVRPKRNQTKRTGGIKRKHAERTGGLKRKEENTFTKHKKRKLDYNVWKK